MFIRIILLRDFFAVVVDAAASVCIIQSDLANGRVSFRDSIKALEGMQTHIHTRSKKGIETITHIFGTTQLNGINFHYCHFYIPKSKKKINDIQNNTSVEFIGKMIEHIRGQNISKNMCLNVKSIDVYVPVKMPHIYYYMVIFSTYIYIYLFPIL